MRCRDCRHLDIAGETYYCSLTGDRENPDSGVCTEFEDRDAEQEEE
jgi:hypothetical protein